METQTDIQDYLERGKQALAQGQGRDAAIAYAHAAQIEPNNPQVHLGLAEANLALGSYSIVQMACSKVQELQTTGAESSLAQSLLNLLDHRYDRALHDLELVADQDPGNAYVHALRAYLLRLTGQDYDAGLERSRAARLSYGGRFENCFPAVDPLYAPSYGLSAASPGPSLAEQMNENRVGSPRGEQEPTWSRPNGLQRQAIRTRFSLSQMPRIVTNILIGVNVLIYLVLAVLSHNPTIDQNVLVLTGAQVNILVAQGQIWRIFTAMFLHFSILHIGLNMLSLFFVGSAIEVMYGKWRYLAIYFASGIIGGIVTYFLSPAASFIAAGASGAIFGVFGALGVFYIVNRQTLGAYGRGAITNWLFWIGLNLVFSFSFPGVGIADHIGGLIAGMLLAYLIMPKLGQRKLG